MFILVQYEHQFTQSSSIIILLKNSYHTKSWFITSSVDILKIYNFHMEHFSILWIFNEIIFSDFCSGRICFAMLRHAKTQIMLLKVAYPSNWRRPTHFYPCICVKLQAYLIFCMSCMCAFMVIYILTSYGRIYCVSIQILKYFLFLNSENRQNLFSVALFLSTNYESWGKVKDRTAAHNIQLRIFTCCLSYMVI